MERFSLCPTIRRPAALATSQTPFRFVSTTLSQSDSSWSNAGRVAVTPALLTTMSIGPKRPSAASSALSMLAAAVTSTTTHCARPFAIPISSTVLASASARRAATVTRAPRAARKTAKKRPRPLEPPVTRTCLPSSENRSLIAHLLQACCSLSSHLVPDQDRSTHRAVEIALVRRGGDRQHVSLQHEVADLVGAGPGLVPRGVDVVDHDVLAQRERACIGHHGAQQLHAFFVRWHYVARRDPAIARENGVHAAARRVADVADRSLAELIVALPVGQALPNIGSQTPRSDYGTIARRIASLHRCQAFFVCRHVSLLLLTVMPTKV